MNTTTNSTLKNKLTNVITMDRAAFMLNATLKPYCFVYEKPVMVVEELIEVRVTDICELYPDYETRKFYLDTNCQYEISDLIDTGANGGGWQCKIEYAGERDITKDYIYSNEYVYTWEVIN